MGSGHECVGLSGVHCGLRTMIPVRRLERSVSGDVPFDSRRTEGVAGSYDDILLYWDQIGVTIAGRHVFDITDGWGGKPLSGIDHVVVVIDGGRSRPDTSALFHFVDGVEAAVAKAQELVGDRMVEVAAGEVGGQALAGV